MPFRLRSFDNAPPGSFPFREEGAKPRNFPAQPLCEAQARIVLGYRKGNGLPRASYVECLEDVAAFQCKRLNNDPRFCVECGPVGESALPLAGNAPGLAPCKGCGVPLEP